MWRLDHGGSRPWEARVRCDAVGLAIQGVQGLQPYQACKTIVEVQCELGVERFIKVTCIEKPLGPSAAALAAAREALAGTHRYPDSSGYRLKGALAERYGVEPTQITLGCGSNDVLDLIARVFLQPGRSAVYSRYGLMVYPIAVQACGARAIV